MGANGSDDDGRDDSWPWNDKWLKSMKDEHDKFFSELKNEGRRLERELRNDDNDSNHSPFTAFKKFVDSNFHALSDGFKNLPSNIAELRAKMQREQERIRQEEADISRRWTGSDDIPDHIQLELQRSTKHEREHALDATKSLLFEAHRRNAHVSTDKIEALFSDPEDMFGYLDRLASPMLSWGGTWYYMPETGDKLPASESWRCLSPQRWLSVDWFKRSPYSPIRLEAHPDLGLEGAKWRAAFEDLMDATLDKPMGSMERIGMRALYGRPQSTYYGPGLEWLLSLQCRGILPPLLPRAYTDAKISTSLRTDASILDTIKRHKTDLSMTPERTLGWQNGMYKDVSDLMSEVATKATAPTEAVEVVGSHTLKPSTEQDLYDSPYIFSSSVRRKPDEHDVPQSQQSQTTAPISAGDEEELDDDDRFDLELMQTLIDALSENDVQTAAYVLKEWYDVYGNVDELVDDEWERYSILDDALKKSDLPDDNLHKQAALRRNPQFAGEPGEAMRKRFLRRLELAKRANVLGGLPRVDYTDEQLEDMVERLEQEHANLERMVGNGQVEQKQEVPKKPEVLSALTTTETTRLPDGTVTTKVVLKKRFADGREEINESVHTTNENLEQHNQQQMEGEEPKKKGWFWL